MTKKEAIEWLKRIEERYIRGGDETYDEARKEALHMAIEALDENAEPRWIPVSERLPEELEEVIITWVNRDPVSYYEQLKDEPMTSTGVYDGRRWWWSSSTCVDYLEEYGFSPADEMDDRIEVLAWMPFPKPYEVTE